MKSDQEVLLTPSEVATLFRVDPKTSELIATVPKDWWFYTGMDTYHCERITCLVFTISI